MKEGQKKIFGAIGVIALVLVLFGPAKNIKASVVNGDSTITASGNLTVDSTTSSAAFAIMPSVTSGNFTLGTALSTGSMQLGGSAMTSGNTTIYGGTGLTGISLIPNGNGQIVIGSATGEGSIIIGDTTANQAIQIGIGSGDGTINIGNGDGDNSINIGTGNGAETVDIGSTSAGSVVNIQSGTGHINIYGDLNGINNLTYSQQLFSTIDSGTPPFVITSSTPVDNLTLTNHPLVVDCGTTTDCSSASQMSHVYILKGRVNLTSGLTSSNATITGFSPSFSDTGSYDCTATDNTAAAAVRVAKNSATSITITGRALATDLVSYTCIGN